MAVIGALRVNLGLDSAQFSKGLTRASRRMQRFAAAARTGLLAVGVAGTAAAAGLAIAVKGAINNADALSKTAQRVGMTTEALSRLQWAAELSGVSIEGLSTGVKKLSQNMLEVSEGRGAQAASSLAALGVAVTDMEGNLRSSNDVLAEIATRFSQMEDGATKTALAMNIFGRAGADMIPMLNQGASGLAAMAAESDKLGITISTKTGRAAEQFNDTLTRIQAVLSGVVNKIAEAVLPALNTLAERLASPDFAAGAQQIAIKIIEAFDLAAQAIGRVGDALMSMGPVGNRSLEMLQEQLASKLPLLDKGDYNIFTGEGITNRGKIEKEISELQAAIAAKLNPANFDVAGVFDSLLSVPQFEGTETDFFQSLRDSAEGLALSIEPITLLGNAMSAANDNAVDLISGFDQVGKTAAQMSIETANAASNVFGSLANLSSGLSSAFKDNKALSIATAVLKGAESIASSFAAGAQIGGPPLGAIYAGVAAITAAANVAAVMSVSENSKSISSSGGGNGSIPTAPANQNGGAGPVTNVTFVGSSFNTEEMAARLNEYAADGGTLIFQTG